MAKTKKEEVVEQTTDEKVETKMATEDGKLKVKKKKPSMKRMDFSDEPVKVDMSKPPVKEEEKQEKEQPKEEKPEDKKDDKIIEEVQEKVEEEKVEDKKEEETEKPVLEEVTEEEVDEDVKEKVEEVEEVFEEAVTKSEETGQDLPENIQKVVDFMNETGGSLEEYVRLNQDYSNYDDNQLLREYLKQTKPHLNDEEISFIMEDLYSWDEEVDEERDIRRKKLALKEQVANAKNHLDGLKSKYYEEIKAGVKLTPDQQKAVDFFNRYNEENDVRTKEAEETRNVFMSETDKLFNKEFKGFEYNVGDKKYRYNVKEADKIKESQSDIGNFASKFVDKKNRLIDPKGYHKALFTANNPDAIANHFYQQGKADAIKDSMAKAKNVDMSPNSTHPNVVEAGGMKVRAVSGDTSSDFKVKIGRNPNKIS